MSDQDSSAPSPAFLKQLKDMMPSMIKGLEEKRIGGKGVKAPVSRPRKLCAICGATWDYASSPAGNLDDITLEKAFCDRCKEQLDAGCIALVSGDRFAFIKDPDPSMQDMRGTVVTISSQNMDKYEQEWGIRSAQRVQQNGDTH